MDLVAKRCMLSNSKLKSNILNVFLSPFYLFGKSNAVKFVNCEQGLAEISPVMKV